MLIGALLLAGMVVLLVGDVRAGADRTPAQLRLQLLVQGLALIAGSVAVAAGLRAAVGDRPREPLLPFGMRGVVVGLAAGVTAALAVTPLIDLAWPELRDPVATVERLDVGRREVADMATVLLLVGLAPLAEEVLFRGVIAAAWSRAGRPVTGVLVSSVLFALGHATVGGRTVVITLVLGLVLGAALLATGTLAVPVAIHALFNAVALKDSGVGGDGSFALVAATVVAVTLVGAGLGAAQVWARPAGRLTLVNRRVPDLQTDG